MNKHCERSAFPKDINHSRIVQARPTQNLDYGIGRYDDGYSVLPSVINAYECRYDTELRAAERVQSHSSGTGHSVYKRVLGCVKGSEVRFCVSVRKRPYAGCLRNLSYKGLLVHFDLLQIAGEPMQEYRFSRLGPRDFGARENYFCAILNTGLSRLKSWLMS